MYRRQLDLFSVLEDVSLLTGFFGSDQDPGKAESLLLQEAGTRKCFYLKTDSNYERHQCLSYQSTSWLLEYIVKYITLSTSVYAKLS